MPRPATGGRAFSEPARGPCPSHLPTWCLPGPVLPGLLKLPISGGLVFEGRSPQRGALWLSPFMKNFSCWIDCNCWICIWYTCSKRPWGHLGLWKSIGINKYIHGGGGNLKSRGSWKRRNETNQSARQRIHPLPPLPPTRLTPSSVPKYTPSVTTVTLRL